MGISEALVFRTLDPHHISLCSWSSASRSKQPMGKNTDDLLWHKPQNHSCYSVCLDTRHPEPSWRNTLPRRCSHYPFVLSAILNYWWRWCVFQSRWGIITVWDDRWCGLVSRHRCWSGLGFGLEGPGGLVGVWSGVRVGRKWRRLGRSEGWILACCRWRLRSPLAAL